MTYPQYDKRGRSITVEQWSNRAQVENTHNEARLVSLALTLAALVGFGIGALINLISGH
jgi:hypothetical protein